MASSSKPQKNGKGRQKIKMEKMENKSNLQVTFSKRRAGLFKKASELTTLTGSQIGLVVFSPGQKVFSFGHPSVHKIMDRCFDEGERGSRNDTSGIGELGDAHRNVKMKELNAELARVELQIEAEKRRAAAIVEREKTELLWTTPVEKMTQQQVDEMSACLHALKDVVTRMENLVVGKPDPGPGRNLSSGPLTDIGNPVFNPMGDPDFNPVDVPVPIPNMGNSDLSPENALFPDNPNMDPVGMVGYVPNPYYN